jgi:hypothetical protein
MKTNIEEWLVTDAMGEWVCYYNPTGHVMHFTRCREEAMQTTDANHAAEVARIARVVYGRKNMRFGIVLN